MDLPLSQAWQLVLPGAGWWKPGPQLEQEVRPGGRGGGGGGDEMHVAKEFTEQQMSLPPHTPLSKIDVPLVGPYLPASQEEHEVPPGFALKVPAGHLMHSLFNS